MTSQWARNMEMPDTALLIHAYGFASDAPPHLAALSGTDEEAIAKAGYYLTSAIIHQGTPWPATGPIAVYVCSLVESGSLNPAAEAVVLDFIEELLDTIEAAQEGGNADWLQQQVAASKYDANSLFAYAAELGDARVAAVLAEVFEDEDPDNHMIYMAFLGLLEHEDAIRAAEKMLGAGESS